MKKSVFRGKKEEISLTLNKELIALIKESAPQIGMDESDFVNGLLTLYFEERGLYKRHSFKDSMMN